MATIIDSLIVQLGLDAHDVDSKVPGVRNKLDSLENSARRTETGFSGLTGALEAFGAVLGSILGAAVITSFAKDIIDTNTQLYYLSQNLGISGQKLNAWGLMARQLGGSAASVQGFFSQIRGMYGQLWTGQTPALLPFFARMGINFNQSPEKIMEQLSEKFKPYDQGPNRWKAVSILSASGLPPDVVNMVLQGPAWVKSHEKDLTALSPTDKQLQASALLTQKIVSVEAAITKLGNDLLSNMMPLLNKISDNVASIIIKHGTAVGVTAGIGAGLLGLTGLVGIGKMLTPIITGLGAALAGVSAPVWGVIAAIAALAAGAYALYKNWPWVKAQAKKVENFVAPTYQAAKGWVKKNKTTIPFNETERTIAKAEGFFSSKDNIPKRAHNPGNILYGKFTVDRGATGYMTAQGGKKIAVFPDDLTGFKAMHELLATKGAKGYANLSLEQKLSRWQTGKVQPIVNGIAGASKVSSSVPSGNSVTHSNVDNSKTVHVGTMNVNPNQQSTQSTNWSYAMDWLFTPQFNGGFL